MMIVKANKQSEAGALPTETALAAMGKYNEELQKAGVLLDLAGLKPTSKGARVQVCRREGDRRRRALHRSQGAGRRLLDHPGEVEGRGDRVGQADPRPPGGRGDRGRDAAVLRAGGLRPRAGGRGGQGAGPRSSDRQQRLEAVGARR